MNKKVYTALYTLLTLTGLAAFSTNSSAQGAVSFSDSLIIKQAIKEKIKDAVKLYPNPTVNGTVTVQSAISGKIHFYIFDQDRTLLYQTVIDQKQKHTFHNLKKGTYLYDVFFEGEGIENGKLIVQ